MELPEIASQLRKPEGTDGQLIAMRMNESNKALTLKAINFLELNSAATLLEIGMGNGAFIPEILYSYPSLSYTGLDFSPDMVAEATVGVSIHGSDLQDRATLILGQALAMPFANATFDRILTVNTLYFMDTAVAFLNECYRVLKPGGTLALAIRDRQTMAQLPFTEFGFNLFSEQDLKEVCNSSKFRAITINEYIEDGTLLLSGTVLHNRSLIAQLTRS
jgi:ubiquinone/menaquinone biosynthesis C-methylase UbiE